MCLVLRCSPQSPFGVWKVVAHKQIELATCVLPQIIVKLWKFFTNLSRSRCGLPSIILKMSCLGTRVPADPNARVPAQSPFHKQLSEKRKGGRLCHLLAKKNFQSFTMICLELNFLARHNFSKPRRTLWTHGIFRTLQTTSVRLKLYLLVYEYNAM
jgi:hypothetical protein